MTEEETTHTLHVEEKGRVHEFTIEGLEFCEGGRCFDPDGSIAALKEAIDNSDVRVVDQ